MGNVPGGSNRCAMERDIETRSGPQLRRAIGQHSRRCLVLVVVLTMASLALAHDMPGWTKYEGNPVMGTVPGEWDASFINDPSIVYDGSTYHMWYYGCNPFGPLTCKIGYATSPDNRVWTKHPDNPVLTNGAEGWDSTGIIGMPSVIYDGAGAFTMWYGWASDSPPEEGTAIGMATSTDGVNWTRYPGNPVLTSGEPGEWDDALDEHSVVFDGESYHMWYLGEFLGSTIGYASSPDGIAWTKHPDPVFEGLVGEEVWDERFLTVTVFLHGGTFHMLYGVDTEVTEYAISYASSPDGVVWTRGPEAPVLAPSPQGMAFDSCALGFHGVLPQGDRATLYYWAWGCQEHDPALGMATASMDEIGVEYPRTDRLNGNRFQVQVLWWDFDDNVGSGVPVRLSDDSGSFWFFDEDNLELMIKVLDGCGINGHYWVFAGGLTNVGVNITVTDLWTDEVVYYLNDLGEAFQPIQDITAFAVCD